MTDEVYDYQQSQKMRAQAAHRTPISPPRMPSEAENPLKDGVCKTLVLPNLPSVAGRVRYAMGGMNAAQFSQRCGISASYLNQLCRGQAKTLTAYNAKRIAGASEMGVTIGWLLGMPKPEKTPPEPPKSAPPAEPELPDTAVKTSDSIGNQKAKSHADDLIESIKDEMLAIGMSTSKMAAQIGVSYGALYNWINQGKTPSYSAQKKIEYYIENLSPFTLDFKKAHAKPKSVQQIQGVFSSETLASIISALKGTYLVNITLEEVEP